ncbi:hypothetical protein SAMN04515695_4308 [Pseudovibrio sp. Tun.PSC04-5.I4]|nr:hypothetical protein SAMN04515695_4308 [Pseudovibrio sp. Tun.PSC04-5.I4]
MTFEIHEPPDFRAVKKQSRVSDKTTHSNQLHVPKGRWLSSLNVSIAIELRTF